MKMAVVVEGKPSQELSSGVTGSSDKLDILFESNGACCN